MRSGHVFICHLSSESRPSPQVFFLSFTDHVLVERPYDGKMRTLEGHQDIYHLGPILSLTWSLIKKGTEWLQTPIHHPPSTHTWMEGKKTTGTREMHIVSLVLCPDNYSISFSSRSLFGNLQGSVDLILIKNLDNEGFHSLRFIYTVLHTSPSLLSRSPPPTKSRWFNFSRKKKGESQF